MWEDPETHVSNGVTITTFVLCQSNQWVAEQWEAKALSTVLLIGHPICLHPYLQILWGQQRLAPSSGAGHISEISHNHTEIWQLLGWCLTNQCTFSSLRKNKECKRVFLNVSSILMFQDYKDKPSKHWLYFITSRIDRHTSKFWIQLLLPVCILVLDLI